MSVFIIALLATILGVAFDYTSNTGIASSRNLDVTGEQGLAEGALEAAFVGWKNYMVTNQSLPIANYTSTAKFAAIISPLRTNLNSVAASSNYVITALNVVAVDRSDNVLAVGQVATDYSVTPPALGTSSQAAASVPGWVGTSYTYRARATVCKWLNKATNTPDTSRSYTVSRYFQQTDCSLFQAMLFFQDDLELHPGPAMTLYGLVHTNSNLYLAAGSGGSLTFSSNVSYHGSSSTFDPASTHPANAVYSLAGYSTGYAEGVTQALYNQESGNWSSFQNPVYTASRNAQLSSVSSLDPLGISTDLAVDPNNANASGTHEIIERPVPNSKADPNAAASTPDPASFANHRLYNSAGLRIFINRANPAHPVTVWTPAAGNVENSTQLPFASGAQAPQLADKIAAAITADNGVGDIYDFREGRSINVDTVDMSKLTPILNAYNAYNGVVYIQDITNMDANGESGASDSIRLKKGGVLPDDGLTLVSDGAVYVQGDYNTGTTYNADSANGAINPNVQPVSNSTTSPDPTKYTVAGYTSKPAAIVGDAVMMLSNAWVDANSYLAIATRNAVPTTFNAALVSGQVVTTASAASGGAHNFPRFLEDWSGDNFTYHGSMAELYGSKHFTGTYGKANVYSPPNRRWYFDNSFLTSPPPGNLRSTTYTRGRWVRDSNA